MPGSLAPASFARAAATWVKGSPKAALITRCSFFESGLRYGEQTAW